MTRLTIFTDGSSLGNPGPGGWAYYCEETKEQAYGSLQVCTNNEAEMHAVQEAIGAAPDGSEVLIVTDSEQVIGFLGKNWKAKANPRLGDYQRAIRMLRDAKGITMYLKKVKGHAGIPGNERVDALAHQAAERAKYLPIPKDDFAPLRLELIITGVDIQALYRPLMAIEEIGGDAKGMATAYDTDGNVTASAEIKGRVMKIVRPG